MDGSGRRETVRRGEEKEIGLPSGLRGHPNAARGRDDTGITVTRDYGDYGDYGDSLLNPELNADT